jgi:energy-coupling factor transport system substrate-specific component
MKFIKGFLSSLATKQGIIAIIVMLVIAVLFVIISKRKKGKGLSTRDVVAIGIGAALYGALSVISLPIGPNTSFRIAFALLVVFGAIFGPVVGFLVGFIGHALNDALMYGSVWWSWVFLSAASGMFGGFVKWDSNFDILAGKISTRHYWQLYLYAIFGIIAGSVLAYAGDVYLYGEPAGKVWLQICLAGVSNFVVLAVVGIPVVIALAKLRSKNNNLEVDG